MDIQYENAENERLEDFIRREGYRRCDWPACNCDSFHGGHAHTRLREIYEALGGCDGTTPVPEIERILADRERLREALDAAEKVVELGEGLLNRLEELCGFNPTWADEMALLREALTEYDKLKEDK